MKIFEDEKEDNPEFPESYDVMDEIKSPLNVLSYNLNYEFVDKYPAKMPVGFAYDMIRLYSKEGDVVLDLMCGSGVVPRVADALNREASGIDINPKAIELAKKHHPEGNYSVGDARYVPVVKQPDLILFSPPFGLNVIGDINCYSDEVHDISRKKTYDEFFGEMKKVFENCFRLLKGGGIMIFDARDRTKDGIYHDLGVEFRNIAMSCGFEIICRYWYTMIPYRQMTYKNKATGFIMPMVSAMDAYVMYKPENSVLQ